VWVNHDGVHRQKPLVIVDLAGELVLFGHNIDIYFSSFIAPELLARITAIQKHPARSRILAFSQFGACHPLVTFLLYRFVFSQNDILRDATSLVAASTALVFSCHPWLYL